MNILKTVTNKIFEMFSDDNTTTTINGKQYSGRNITITNDLIIIDGVIQTDNIVNVKKIDIVVEGSVKSLHTTSGTVRISGNATDVSTTSGDVFCSESVLGDIKTTSGDVDIQGNVSGKVETVSGDVKCQTIGGNVKTVSGDVSNTFNLRKK